MIDVLGGYARARPRRYLRAPADFGKNYLLEIEVPLECRRRHGNFRIDLRVDQIRKAVDPGSSSRALVGMVIKSMLDHPIGSDMREHADEAGLACTSQARGGIALIKPLRGLEGDDV